MSMERYSVFSSGKLRQVFPRSLFGMGGNQSYTESDGSQEANFIKKSVDSNCVVIFSKTTCPYCHQAKGLFEKLAVPFESIEINKREDGRMMSKVLADMTNSHTVPKVFVNGKCIGGASETKQLYESGKLRELVEQCCLSR